MKCLSELALNIQPSSTLAIDALYKQMKADGVDVIGFGAGEPDFETPEAIKRAGIAAIEQNETKYTPSNGTVELRQAICRRLWQDFQVGYGTEEVSVSNGAKTCVYASLRVLINPGDEVILPTPYWVSYIELIRLAGGVPVLLETGESEAFKITPQKLESRITPRTKCIILNNPSNPTGMMYDEAELRGLGEVCVRHDLYIIADEIYAQLVYDGRKFTSVASISPEIKERTLLVNGVSKTYAMTGWRIGYVAAPKAISKVISNYLGHCTGSPCAISQKAALEALTGDQSPVERMRAQFEQRRNYMVQRINQMPGVSCLMPNGAFYVMMNLENLMGRRFFQTKIESADDFGRVLLQHGNVAVVPGTGFGAPNFVRWSYAASMEQIKAGLDRLEQCLAAGR